MWLCTSSNPCFHGIVKLHVHGKHRYFVIRPHVACTVDNMCTYVYLILILKMITILYVYIYFSAWMRLLEHFKHVFVLVWWISRMYFMECGLHDTFCIYSLWPIFYPWRSPWWMRWRSKVGWWKFYKFIIKKKNVHCLWFAFLCFIIVNIIFCYRLL